MTVFTGVEGQPGMGQARLEKCKRDYEQEIAYAKKRNAATTRLLLSLEEYLDEHGYYHNGTFTLPALYGALSLEMREQHRNIERLQEEWEAEK